MKKLLAITLTVAMLFTMTAMAENIVDETNGNTHNVFAKYAGNEGGATIYSVDITWGSLEYTYNDANAGTWDPTTHTYKGVSEAGWTCVEGADTISVTNHSNAGISVMVNYENESGIENVEGIIENENFNLPSAENKSVEDSELTDTAKLIMSGELDSNYETMTKVGTVTIVISDLKSNTDESEDSSVKEVYDVDTIRPKNTEANLQNPLLIEVNGENFNIDNIKDILEGIRLTIKGERIPLDINSTDLSYNYISSNLFEIIFNLEYFNDYFSMPGVNVVVTEFSYLDNIMYTGSINITNS